MRILLLGKGHLGSFLSGRLNIAPELWWKEEIANLSEAKLLEFKPEVIINTVGKTDLKWCEENQSECWRCNVVEPLMLYRRIGKTLRCPLVHISSACVWDGPFNERGEPFNSWDAPTPACFYSWTKAAFDAMVMDEAKTGLIILRPRQVYSPLRSPRNTLSKLLSYPKLLDTPNSMTSAETIAKTIEAFMGPIGLERTRITNVYDAGWTTPFRVGELLAEAGLRTVPEKLTKEELDGWHKPKRVDAVIADNWFEYIAKPPKVEDELRRVIAEFARS